MPISLEELNQQTSSALASHELLPVDMVVPAPENFKVTGKEGFFRLQWSPAPESVDGYQVAISTTQNIDTPDVGLLTVVGIKSQFADYLVGNVVLTRYFAVRSFQGFPPRYFSDFSSVASAASRLMTATPGASEPSSPSSPPATSEPPPSGSSGGLGGSSTA